MRRLLPAAVLALALHGLLLAVPPRYLPKRPVPTLRPETIRMALIVQESKRPTPPPAQKTTKTPVTVPPKVEQAPVQRPPKETPKVEKPEPAPKKIKRSKPAQSLMPAPKPVPTPVRPMNDSSSHAGETVVPEESASGPRTFLEKVPHPEFSKAESTPAGALRAPAPAPLVQAVPVYQKNPVPPYPRIARRRGYEGTVILEVLVDREGKVDELRVARSSGYPILDRAALGAVKRWVFKPGKHGNEPIEMWVRVPLRFQLK